MGTKIRVLESFLTLNLSLITNSIRAPHNVKIYAVGLRLLPALGEEDELLLAPGTVTGSKGVQVAGYQAKLRNASSFSVAF